MPQHLDFIELESSRPQTTGSGLRATTFQSLSESRQNEQSSNQPVQTSTEHNEIVLGKVAVIILIIQLTTTTAMSSFTTGLITVAIPQMAADLKLEQSLIYWPVLVYSLASGSCLLVAGAVADVLGTRVMNILGCFLLGISIIACGLAHTGIELIMFRAIQGIAAALYLPTSLGIMSRAIHRGKMRNVGFSCLGFGQVIGFAIGLVLGGVFVSTIGWRVGYYACGSMTTLVALAGIRILPQDPSTDRMGSTLQRLKNEIDWTGALLASSSMALLAYVLAQVYSFLIPLGATHNPYSMVTTSTSYIRRSYIIALLVLSLALMPAFVFWVSRQERLQKPALIPNSFWRNVPFTSVCLMILFAHAVMQTFELLTSLYFQQVQHLSAIQSSIRFLPSLIFGAILEIGTGLLVHRIPAIYLVLIASVLSTGSPVLMALIKPSWPYWYDAFPAQLLEPLSVEVIFTVGLLVISDVFPTHKQAIAGAVFNTIAQFGQALGLALIAVITNSVTQQQSKYPVDSAEGLLVGYRAGFWTSFVWTVVATAVGAFGLRKIGKVGLKND